MDNKPATRPVRNRRHSRRAWPLTAKNDGTTIVHDAMPQHRMQKRLFTPEIKRMLKDWLVRRRDNPYPSRDEKKALAIGSGLTYIQICNWFANWRRKLKNTGREPSKRTWGTLIKNYNDSANGNVEQFSISSNDSIWSDDRQKQMQQQHDMKYNHHHHPDYRPSVDGYYDQFGGLMVRNVMHRNDQVQRPTEIEQFRSDGVDMFCGFVGSKPFPQSQTMTQEQCFQITSTTTVRHQLQKSPTQTEPTEPLAPSPIASSVDPNNNNESRTTPSSSFGKTSTTTKYKSNIMEKYLRDIQPEAENAFDPNNNSHMGNELSKWLESAANFTPDKKNYIDWDDSLRMKDRQKSPANQRSNESLLQFNHEREEVEAAEALTCLAGNYRSRMFGLAAAPTADTMLMQR